ncbi:hypothetical protein [Actinoplanes sp. HUAS TT8]
MAAALAHALGMPVQGVESLAATVITLWISGRLDRLVDDDRKDRRPDRQ